MRFFFLYFLFALLFNNIDSFFFNKLKNTRIFYNRQINNLSKKKTVHLKKPRYTIHHNKHNIKLEYNNITNYFFDNKYLTDKNIINIYPAGLRGFYEMGICVYIKENYNIDNYVFSGASAGAWNSLLLSYKGDPINFKNFILEFDNYDIKSLEELQKNFKNRILLNFKSDDFDLKKIFIGVTVLEKFKFKNYIFTDFESLEDAIDCVIASSNIPFITGKLFYKYKNKLCFDGGFSKDPYIHNPNIDLLIYPEVFKNTDVNNIQDLSGGIIENDLFEVDFKNIVKLFEKGYNDAIKYDNFVKKHILNIT
tara:strand:- start:66 stop:989 length:924 start_codon:yes stop_codon:yes gene_type:complete